MDDGGLGVVGVGDVVYDVCIVEVVEINFFWVGVEVVVGDFFYLWVRYIVFLCVGRVEERVVEDCECIWEVVDELVEEVRFLWGSVCEG